MLVVKSNFDFDEENGISAKRFQQRKKDNDQLKRVR